MARHRCSTAMVIGIVTLLAAASSAQDCLNFASYPYLDSWIDLPHPRAVVVDDEHAFVTDAERGLVIVRHEGVGAPEIAAELALAGSPYELALHEETLFIASREPDLLVVDVRDPAAPIVVTSLTYPGDADALALEDGRLYLLSSDALRVLNVEKPRSPYLIGTIDLPRDGYQIDVENGYAYIGTWADEELTIIDATVPAAMQVVTFVATPSVAHDVSVVGDLAFVADRSEGLIILDVTDPAAPSIIGSSPTLESACTRVHAPGGRYVFVGDGYAGLQIVDVVAPARPKIVGRIGSALTWQVQIATRGDRVFVPVADSGLQILDIASVGIQPRHGVFADAGFAVEDIVLVDDRAFIAGAPTLWSLRVDPRPAGSPTTVLELSDLAHKLDRDGDRLYVAAGENGIAIVDIEDPDSPRVLGSHPTANAAHDVKALGSKLLVAMQGGDRDLKIFDVDDPTAPWLVSSTPMPADATAVEIVGPYAYVAAGDLVIVDIGDVSAPQIVDFLSLDADARHLEVLGDVLYVSSASKAGLHVVDIADPGRPEVLVRVGSPLASGGNFTIADPYVFVARGVAGVQVLDISRRTAPRHSGFIEAGYQVLGTRGVAARRDLVVTGNLLGLVQTTSPPCLDFLGTTPQPLVDRSGADDPDRADRVDADELAVSVAPNPANPRAEIRLVLERGQHVRVAVHDLGGRRIAELHDGRLEAGEHRLSWSGRDGSGRAAPSGVYLVRVDGRRISRSVKVQLVK